MKYRLLVVFCALVLLGACDAFDNSSEPFAGFSPDEVPVKSNGAGIYTGYYAGDMTVEANNCEAVSDKAGSKVATSFDVMHKDTLVSVTIGKEAEAVSGTLSDEKTTLMTETANVRHIYYITFAKDKVEGSCEVIEMGEDGQYGQPCATYKLSLDKGEKPAADAKEEEKKPAEDTKKPK